VDTLLGIIIGGVITFLTSRWYYHRASEDLRQEAKELRHYLSITLRVLQALPDNKHSFVINWDEHGRPTGVSRHAPTTDQDSAQDSVDTTSESPDEDDE
jgi:uncharacterized membrane protein YccC